MIACIAPGSYAMLFVAWLIAIVALWAVALRVR